MTPLREKPFKDAKWSHDSVWVFVVFVVVVMEKAQHFLLSFSIISKLNMWNLFYGAWTIQGCEKLHQVKNSPESQDDLHQTGHNVNWAKSSNCF